MKKEISADLYFSTYKIQKILCPICGSRRFHIESRHNGGVEFWCRGKRVRDYDKSTSSFIWKQNGCPWRVLLSKGDLIRAAIKQTEEEAKVEITKRGRKVAEYQGREERNMQLQAGVLDPPSGEELSSTR